MKKSSLSLWIATWFKTGLIPPIFLKGMAGTYGSFFALPVCLLGVVFSQFIGQLQEDSSILAPYIIFSEFIFLLGFSTVKKTEKELGPRIDWKGKTKDRDQNQIVIDEVFGMVISCFPIIFLEQYSWVHFAAAFAFFRFFDIVKVPPTKYFDNMKNAFGVMMDDGIAGIYAAIILEILIFYKVWIF